MTNYILSDELSAALLADEPMRCFTESFIKKILVCPPAWAEKWL